MNFVGEQHPTAGFVPEHLMSTLAHEIRQPLSNIESIAYYLSLIVPVDNLQVQDQLTRIRELVEQSNGILSGGARLAEARPAQPESVDLNAIVAEVIGGGSSSLLDLVGFTESISEPGGTSESEAPNTETHPVPAVSPLPLSRLMDALDVSSEAGGDTTPLDEAPSEPLWTERQSSWQGMTLELTTPLRPVRFDPLQARDIVQALVDLLKRGCTEDRPLRISTGLRHGGEVELEFGADAEPGVRQDRPAGSDLIVASVRKIVEAHAGTLEVDAASGIRVCVVLP